MRWCNLDKRYPHYLEPLSDRDGPDRVVVVDPVGALKGSDGNYNVRVEVLRKYHARCYQRVRGRLVCVATKSGASAGSFWLGLRSQLKHPGILWIVCYQGGRAWALLELWDRLENRDVYISGGDHRHISDPDSAAKLLRPGLLVAEDPPCIAQLRLRGCPGQALWLDCRNWGIELPEDTKRGENAVKALGDVVTRMDGIATAVLADALCPTAAGQAWRYFRKLVQLDGAHCHVHPSAMELERRAHLGGRCEAFIIGKPLDNVYHLDFRSHYGAIMATAPLPYRLMFYARKPHPGDAERYASECNAIATVRIHTYEPVYPLLREGIVIYPTGEFTTTLAGPELQLACERGDVVGWIGLAVYDMKPIASQFAAAMYGIRLAADEAKHGAVSSWAKYMMNALTGKLGCRLKYWQTEPTALAPCLWGEWTQMDSAGHGDRWRSLMGVCQREIVGGYAPDAIPSMACFINAYGRARLWAAMEVAARTNVAYVDTDSMIVSQDGYERLVSAGLVADGELGKLEVRYGPGQAIIHGIKHYEEGDTIKCAGTPKGIITRSADGKGYWYTPAAVLGTRTRRTEGTRTEQRKWPSPAAYRHGVVGINGVVTPHHIAKGGK